MNIVKNLYQTLADKRDDSQPLRDCVVKTIKLLSKNTTTSDKPGMLLGKIQSGKTNAYLGIIALVFDKGYDIAVVLQKGTKALSEQTYQRIKEDYKEFIQSDMVQVFDIMNFPDNLTQWELRQKMIVIAKKQSDNLKRVMIALSDTYPDLKNKKVLIIDDEADFASICFRKNSNEDKIEQGKIASQIDELRNKVADSQYLQVTATPYSLYLQPDESEEQNGLFKPKRPAFTVLVPSYPGYIGGDYYFLESENENSPARFIFNEISTDERDTLKKEDRRSFKTEEVLFSEKVQMIRNAVVNFIIGASIRRLQQKDSGQQKKYSFIVHTEQGKASHDWQITIINKLKSELVRILKDDVPLLDNLIQKAYDNLIQSIKLNHNLIIPEVAEVKKAVHEALNEGYLMITKVNSDKEVKELLDERGQLRLRTPLNIYVGGQILDRGITVDNLIGFYYGRNPQKFQQDTVLQHSRMYGFRTEDDLTVTRFYTTLDIYQVMKRIHEFDSELRKVLEKDDVEQRGVYFIRKDDSNKVVPCSPNKILLSNITTLKPFKRLLPIGFQTGYKTNIRYHVDKLDKMISDFKITEEPLLVDFDLIQEIIDIIGKTLEFEKGYEWDIKTFLGSIEYLLTTG